jgi:hypothetical protein
MFYIYLSNALAFVRKISNPEEQFQWDDEVLEFVETLEYHRHEKILNLLLKSYGHKCVKSAVLAISMDSESKNQAAFK